MLDGQTLTTNNHYPISKGSWRDREVEIKVNGYSVERKEVLMYRSAPSNGVKVCSQRPCRVHMHKSIHTNQSVSPCPVEYGYLYPKDYQQDHRRRIFGFVRQQKEISLNVHNHPIHGSARMCSKVKECIAMATLVNPSIKPFEIAKGKVSPLFQVL